MSDDYSGERYNPTIASCSTLTLHFNSVELIMRGGSKVYRYPAVSGRPISGKFDYSVEAQKKRNSGPIPEGTYWIKPDEMWENAWYKIAPYESWGNYRITIHPFTTTETYKRGGFFIHGGTVPGSIGCIDLTTHMDQFVRDLKAELGGSGTCQIHLFVQYPQLGDYPTSRNRNGAYA